MRASEDAVGGKEDGLWEGGGRVSKVEVERVKVDGCGTARKVDIKDNENERKEG
jgi:hypothetical protein